MKRMVGACMELILDGNSEHPANAWSQTRLFEEKKIRFVSDLGLIKCFKQIKWQILLPTCALSSELQSNISTMAVNPSFHRVNCGFIVNKVPSRTSDITHFSAFAVTIVDMVYRLDGCSFRGCAPMRTTLIQKPS